MRKREKYGRVLFLKEYASFIKDTMISELTDLSKNLILSIDVQPVQTDEAIKEAENRLLGIETNITNYVRKQAESSLVVEVGKRYNIDNSIQNLSEYFWAIFLLSSGQFCSLFPNLPMASPPV